MNKDEIKKAFDICCDAQTQSCTGCPILELEKRNGHGCKYNMFISVFDLITEQENEIERLKEEKKQAQIDVLNDVKDVLANQKHECLERNNLVGYSAIAVCEKYIDVIINEVENDK